MPSRSTTRPISSRLTTTLAAALLLSLAFVAVTVVFAARESDRLAVERQSSLAAHLVDDRLALLPHDQQSVTIWDDAVRNTKETFNEKWVHTNLGEWMHDYFGHDMAFVLSDAGRPLYAMADGRLAESSNFALVRPAAAPLIEKVQTSMRERAADPDAETPSAADLAIVNGRPAIVSAMPIVSDSGDIAQTPGTEYLHVAVRFLDGNFVEQLRSAYRLTGARFSWTPSSSQVETAYPLRSASGASVGSFYWTPERPGGSLLVATAPVAAGAFVLVCSVLFLLFRQLKQASKSLEASEAQAQRLAFHDALTGLPNRALFNDRLGHALAAVRRGPAGLALLYLDLDRFKNVNDTLGHPIGDELIRQVARRLQGVIRETDTLARLGGDEFAIIQCAIDGPQDAEALCERILTAMREPFNLSGAQVYAGASIGVSLAPEAGVDRGELARKADIALYRCKAEGRGCFRVFAEQMDENVQQKRTLESDLRRALQADDQLRLAYQPLYSATDGSVVGVEALVRWDHPTRGSLSPGVFVTVAEESGLIERLGEWILREACSVATAWPFATLAVNVSPVQLRVPSFARRVVDILRSTGMDPRRLELEITEGILLENEDFTAHNLRTLRKAGVRIALDDFGTGYSSIAYLHTFKVDRIKIDRSFVQQLGTDESSGIVQAMINLAHAMGMQVTAEGVETLEQRRILADIGCNELQGFLMSRPVSSEELDSAFGVVREKPRSDAAA